MIFVKLFLTTKRCPSVCHDRKTQPPPGHQHLCVMDFIMTRGSRSGFWQNEKPHKFNKSVVLISNYVDFFEPVYHVYKTQNVGFDFEGDCKS